MQQSSTMHKSMWNRHLRILFVPILSKCIKIILFRNANRSIAVFHFLPSVFHENLDLGGHAWCGICRKGCVVVPYMTMSMLQHIKLTTPKYCLKVLLLPQFFYHLQDSVLLLLRLVRMPKNSCPNITQLLCFLYF